LPRTNVLEELEIRIKSMDENGQIIGWILKVKDQKVEEKLIRLDTSQSKEKFKK